MRWRLGADGSSSQLENLSHEAWDDTSMGGAGQGGFLSNWPHITSTLAVAGGCGFWVDNFKEEFQKQQKLRGGYIQQLSGMPRRLVLPLALRAGV